MRDLVLKIAWAYLGRPYIWGGDNPSGFDCSGLAIECLKSVGLLPRKGDWTAEGLYRTWVTKVANPPRSGDLVFWAGESGKMVHVEIVCATELSIGASGGGSDCTDAATALKKGAFVKVRPYRTRGGEFFILNPYLD